MSRHSKPPRARRCRRLRASRLRVSLSADVVLMSSPSIAKASASRQNNSLAWYRLLFHDSAIWDSVFNSLLVAAAAVVLSHAGFSPLQLSSNHLPGQIPFPPPRPSPADPSRHHHRPLLLMFAVSYRLSLASPPSSSATAPRSSPSPHRTLRRPAKIDRARKKPPRSRRYAWQTFWRVTLPNLKLVDRRGPPHLHPLDGRNRVTFFLIGRDNSPARNLGPPAPRHHPGDQRHFHPDFRRFRNSNFDLVPDSRPHDRQRSKRTFGAPLRFLRRKTPCHNHAAISSSTS